MAQAQDRLPPIPADQLTAEQRQAVAEFGAARNAPMTGPFIPMLHSPEVMKRARAMGDYLRYKTALTPRQSEFVILMAARSWSQQVPMGGALPDCAQGRGDGRGGARHRRTPPAHGHDR